MQGNEQAVEKYRPRNSAPGLGLCRNINALRENGRRAEQGTQPTPSAKAPKAAIARWIIGDIGGSRRTESWLTGV